MSQAHRPTWNPTQGRETKAGSRQIAKLSLASHKKLKFRQPGQGTSADNSQRDLRAELARAERAAQDRKRKAAGLAPLPPMAGAGALRIEGADGREGADGEGDEDEDEETRKRRKVLEQALEDDRDDSSDDDSAGGGAGAGGRRDKGKGRAVDGAKDRNGAPGQRADDDDEEEDDDDEDDDDDDDDEDDTAALMAELAKIKQERAEEKARMDAEKASSEAIDREFEIATGNPLLNLQAALGQSPSTPGTPASTAASSAPSSFAVKRRWDDDLIFKNQAAGISDKGKKGEFVNDLLRSEFHKKFMQKFIK